MHGDDIRVSFDQKTAVCFDDGFFGEIVAVKLVTLLIDFAFRAVAEATEEAVLNSLAAADGVIGWKGKRKPALSQLYSLEEF